MRGPVLPLTSMSFCAGCAHASNGIHANGVHANGVAQLCAGGLCDAANDPVRDYACDHGILEHGRDVYAARASDGAAHQSGRKDEAVWRERPAIYREALMGAKTN